MIHYLKLMRPQQWIKNLFLFAPLFFSFQYSPENIVAVFEGFILFSLASSGLYSINDVFDREEDRQHPEKKDRPVASGKIGTRSAVFFAIVLLIVALSGAALLDTSFLMVLGIYVIMILAYSLKLKQISILDITLIAGGFVLRIYAGAELIDVTPTNWIVLVTFLLALFLALAKRRDDVLLGDDGIKTRKNADGYNLEMINAGMVFMAGVTTVAYIMYTMSEDVIDRLDSENIYLTSGFVVIGILRYMQITFVENRSGNPTYLVIKDIFLQVTIICWLISFLIFYFLI
ncbi:MAG: prenyltransferase [Bacteroidetes bacterium]|jgi:4-hydroxybenzoate polyprenyltransferase|nr:prenyltransferase [Bacteroidota bacterium]